MRLTTVLYLVMFLISSLALHSNKEPIDLDYRIFEDNLKIYFTKDFIAQDEYVQRKQIKMGLRELLKLPPTVLQVVLGQEGKRLYFIANNITEHPVYEDLKGVQIEDEGYDTWDTLPGLNGVGSDPIIVAPSRLFVGFGKPNLLLHETAHAFDQLLGRPSEKNIWLKVHSTCSWSIDYFRKNPRESFARSIALFYHDLEALNQLNEFCPSAVIYIEELVKKLPLEAQEFKSKLDRVLTFALSL